jgi:hypothetical protein
VSETEPFPTSPDFLVAEIPIEQATFSRSGDGEPILLAKSSNFRDEWLAPIQKTLIAFGARPVGVACPSAVFAAPLGRGQVMVVDVADLDESDTSNRPLGFHVIIVPRKAYTRLWHDPFRIAERLPPDWSARGTLPSVSWPDVLEPVRTVEQVRAVLRRVRGEPLSEDMPGEEQIRELEENSESPVLLGGAQILVDGGRLLFQRARPDTDLLRALWMLLPNSVRGELWPASFAFSNELGFDVLVVPRFTIEEYRGYTTEELAADYPDSRYEHSLQLAATHGDQQELNALFERRSQKQTWRLGIVLIIVMGLIALLARPLPMPTQPKPAKMPVRVRLGTLAAGEGHQPTNLLPLVPLMDEESFKQIRESQLEDQP